MKNIVFIIGICLLFSVDSHALVGGEPVVNGEFRSVVSLRLSDANKPDYDFFCSGVIIAPNKVLTAAHCIAGMSDEIFDDSYRFIKYPEVVTVDYEGTIQRAKSIAYAPNYFEEAGDAGEDLAIIELSVPFKNAKPIKLMKPSELEDGMPLTMVARGYFARTKLKSFTVFPKATALYLDTTMSAVCRGDSGGALLAQKNGQWVLAGILIYYNREDCNEDSSLAFFPKALF